MLDSQLDIMNACMAEASGVVGKLLLCNDLSLILVVDIALNHENNPDDSLDDNPDDSPEANLDDSPDDNSEVNPKRTPKTIQTRT